MTTLKLVLSSKTFWANALVSALVYLGQAPASWQPFLPYLVAGINIALQFLNNKPLKVTLK